jgi:hypothetical protein
MAPYVEAKALVLDGLRQAANPLVCFDHDNGNAELGQLQRSGQAGGAGTYHDDR